MLVDFALMTVQEKRTLISNVLVHTGPHKLTGYCRESGFFPQISKTVDSVEHLLKPWCRNERSGVPICCITH